MTAVTSIIQSKKLFPRERTDRKGRTDEPDVTDGRGRTENSFTVLLGRWFARSVLRLLMRNNNKLQWCCLKYQKESAMGPGIAVDGKFGQTQQGQLLRRQYLMLKF